MMTAFFSGHWVDILYIAVLMGFILTSKGLFSTILEIFSFITSLLLSYRLYSLFGYLFSTYFHLPVGIANAVGFFMAWVIVETILYMLIFYVSNKFLPHIHNNVWNMRLGFIAAIVQGSVIFLFIITLIFALPVRGNIKNDILKSQSGPFFVNLSQNLQLITKHVFGGAVSEALNFMTIKPESNERVELGFNLKNSEMRADADSEDTLLQLLNKERTQRGLKALIMNEKLRNLARSYGTVLFEGGFFSHVSKIDNSSPGDRANKAGVEYTVLGENLAFAPDVYIAHQGLMNSEGHRANILGKDYNKVGLGVVDGGVYGKMFVQEFSN